MSCPAHTRTIDKKKLTLNYGLLRMYFTHTGTATLWGSVWPSSTSTFTTATVRRMFIIIFSVATHMYTEI